MELLIRHRPDQRLFEGIGQAGGSVLNYERDGPRMVITHTYVPPELRGRGCAAALVEEALAYAREQGWKVVPQCSYVNTFMHRRREYGDLLHPEFGS